MPNVPVSACPHCGAPIYQPETWEALTPPPVTRTCSCVPETPSQKAGTDKPTFKKIPLLRLK